MELEDCLATSNNSSADEGKLEIFSFIPFGDRYKRISREPFEKMDYYTMASDVKNKGCSDLGKAMDSIDLIKKKLPRALFGIFSFSSPLYPSKVFGRN